MTTSSLPEEPEWEAAAELAALQAEENYERRQKEARQDGAEVGSQSETTTMMFSGGKLRWMSPYQRELTSNLGAVGGDVAWNASAKFHGHSVTHYSFASHRTCANVDADTVVILTESQLHEADSALNVAARRLRRSAGRPTTKRLLQRNWWLMRSTSSLYAVGQFDDATHADNIGLTGGTAWACQMFADKWSQPGASIPMYFFSQKDACWFQFAAKSTGVYSWHRLTEQPPRPSGRYTAIGTRELTDVGRQAIAALFDEEARIRGE